MSNRRSPDKNKPSVLFVVSHDLGAQHGCYGGPAVTPHQDALAAEGLCFDRHYVHYPLCGPSRANLFTGCRPLTTERFNNQPFMPGFRERMGEGFRTLPEQFRRAGYRTRGFGLVFHDVADAPSWEEPIWRAPDENPVAKAHPDLPRTLTAGDNKDWATDGAYQLIRKRWKELQATGFTEEDLQKNPSVARKAQGLPVEAAPVDDSGYEDGVVTDAALEYLQDVPDGEPFFMAVGLVTGHTPFRAPRKYFDLYQRDALPLPDFREPPEGSPEWVSGDSEPSQYYTRNGYELPWKASEEQCRELLHGHLAAASYIDAQIGRLTSKLKECGRYEDTIVVAISDHGFHDGQHGYWGKHNLWEHSLRAPFILRLPKTPPLPGLGEKSPTAGEIVAGITEHVDIFPTLCDLCGLAKPQHLEGRSMLSQILDPAGDGGRAAFAHRKHMWHDRIKAYEVAHTVRTDRYRYTEYRNQHDTAIYQELFDYENDPDERLNHISIEEYRGIAGEMKNLLDRYLAAPKQFFRD